MRLFRLRVQKRLGDSTLRYQNSVHGTGGTLSLIYEKHDARVGAYMYNWYIYPRYFV